MQVPYLLDTKVKVKFEGITLNTERQLIAGKLVTTYDKTEKNVIVASEELQKITEGVKTLTDQKDTIKIADQVQNHSEEEKIKNNNSEEMIALQNTEKDRFTDTTSNTDEALANNITAGDTNNLPSKNEISTPETKNKEKISKEVYFSYKNKKYRDKDTITLPYNRNNKITLGIEGIDKNEYVNWLSKDGLERTKYISNKKRTVNTKVLNSLKMLYYAPSQEDFLNNKYDTLQAFLRYKFNDFTIKELYARDLVIKDGGNKREAKSGEVLYLVSGPASEGERKEVAEYEVVISPKLKEDEFPTYDLKWDYGYPNTKHKDDGKLKIRKGTYEKWKGLDTISVTGGYPNPTTKKIMVKTIGENRTTISAMPPGVSEVLTKRIEQIGDQLRFVDRKI